jgi:NodT family efflux transporter outer membrane factor (OMF) lipoprotein
MRRAVLLCGLCLAGCAVGPTYRAPPPGAPQLREAPAPAGASTPLPARWWQLFNDADLDRLVEAALAHNTDLRQAAADLQRARAALSEARAGRWPADQLSAAYSRERISPTATGVPLGPAGGGPITTDLYTAGLDMAYEADLFGGVTRSIQAARADAQAAQATLDAARVSVAAETASAYSSACGFAAQTAVARETAELQGRTFDLTRRAFGSGRGTARDVAEAQVLVDQAQAQVATFEGERRAALYALAVLTGDPPETVDGAADRCTTPPTTAAPIPVGDGRALLARRPDVRAAERTLAARVADIGVATAQLYPSITLAGTVTVGAPRLGDLGRSRALGYTVGPAISWSFPFNGAARARVRESRANAQAALAAFDGSLLRALQETERALARLNAAEAREASLGRAAAAASQAADISDRRFRSGSDSFLQLLVAQRERADARAALAQAQADRAGAQISVFKALGGGWEQAPAVVSPPLPAAGHQGGR